MITETVTLVTAADGTRFLLRRDPDARAYCWRAYNLASNLTAPVLAASTKTDALIMIEQRHGYQA